MRNKLSVIVLTQNEEENIVDCLETVKFADELIVIDDKSTDRTLDLAKKFTNKIIFHPLNKNFANQRNYALNFVHNEWVLFIDADERVSDELKHEIARAIELDQYNGYFIKRKDKAWGKIINYGEAGNIELLRLARAKSGKWRGNVHEVWKITGNTKTLDNPLIHIPHSTIKKFVKDIDEYSTIRAQELLEKDNSSNFVSIISYPFGKFVLNYVIRKGYRDGIPGLLYAILMSFHSFLVRAKLYLKTQNE